MYVSGQVRERHGEYEVQALPGAHPKTYSIVKLDYNADVHDIEPLLIQPAFFHCMEPSDVVKAEQSPNVQL